MVLGVGLAGAIFTTSLASHPGSGGGAALFSAIRVSFLVTTGIAFLGVITASIKETFPRN
jgi:hypothetical protein